MSFSLRTLRVLLTSTLILSVMSVIPAQGTTVVTPSVAQAAVGPVVVAPTSLTSAEEKPSAVTDARGAFRFDGLEKGTHQLYLDTSTLPAELRPAAGASRVDMWINPGQSLVSDPIGAGVRLSASYDRGGSTISGVVFVDYNADGQQGPGEPGLAGVTVIDPNIHQYFVPFDDQDLIAMFDASNECQPSPFAVGDRLASRISLTASADGTVYYYDHWEDGYDPDPLSPATTTDIGMLNAGKTRIFEDDVNTADPSWGTTDSLYYDGRDRITIFGEAASVIRGASPSLTDSPIGTRLAGAWEIDEVANWGTEYIVPAGEDWAVPDSDFSFTAATITAFSAGTQIFYNGTLVTTTVTAGAPYFIPGAGDGTGLASGDRITATGPIQVHAYSSACAPVEEWSGNGYTLQPRDHWSNDYWSPVPSRAAGPTCRNDAEMDIFLYNDNGADIPLAIDDGTLYTPVLPAGTFTTVRALIGTSLSITRGVHIQGSAPFWGIVNMDTGGADHEWGYSLIPESELSSQVVLGWAPGNDLTPPLAQWPPSGNLAFVTAITDTTVFADFDQDGNPDPIDCNGDGDALDFGVDNLCDEPSSANGVDLDQGLTLRIADPIDADLTGALIYTQDLSQKIAVAWGQDPCVADSDLPYIDMGYTVLPVAIPSLTKTDALADDRDASGDITPGDILTYTVIIANNGQGPMTNVVMTDVLPYTYTDFIVGSIVSTLPATIEEYFDGTDWSYVPPGPPGSTDDVVQQFRLGWPTINAKETVTVTFNVWIQTDIPPDVDEITNVAIVNSDETTPRDSEDPDDPGDPDTDTLLGQPILWLDKHPSDPGTVAPGGVLTYTIVVSNVGTATALSALVVDDLPPWLSYITDTLDLTWPTGVVSTTFTPISQTIGTFTGTYGDNFDLTDHLTGTTAFTGSDGTLTWLTDWLEINDNGVADTGDARVDYGDIGQTIFHSPQGYALVRGNDDTDGEAGLRRCADLSEFAEPHLSYQLQGDTDNTDPDDVYRVEITSTASISTFTPTPYADTTWVAVDLNLSDFAGESLVCVTYVAAAGMDTTPRDVYRIDDVFIYDAAPDRYGTFILIEEIATISYRTRTSINPPLPDGYIRLPSDPFTPAITHTMRITDPFPFLPGSNVTASFQVRVGYPLTDGLQMFNTASITATNLLTTPYPLTDTVPTLIQSSHALTITKTDDHDPVIPGELLTYTLVWEVGGDEPAPGVVVTDTLPLPYVSFFSCAGGLSCGELPPAGSGVVAWALGDHLPPMSGITYVSGTLTLTVRVEQSPPIGVFTNTVIIDDATDTPTDEDDEPTRVPASYMLSKQRLTDAWVNISDTVQFLIVITNTGTMTITRLPLEDRYDTTYLSYQGADPSSEDNLDDGVINWSDLTTTFGPVVPGADVQVTVNFIAISSTEHLSPPVTINTAITEGAMTDLGELPRQEDDADVGIGEGTAIELLYLRANPKSGGVLVEWATLFEIGTYGFWLYRGQDDNVSNATPVAFIPAEGWFGLGAAYQYLDAELPAGVYYYWLVEEEFSGTLTTYGPVSSWSGWDEADLPYRIYLPLLGK